MSYLDQKIQYYESSVYKTEPIGTCTLRQMLEAIKSPKPEVLELFKKIEKASKEGNKVLKDRLKSQLYYFTPCITTDGLGRKYSNIIDFNGILILDFDNLEEEFAISLKEFLFSEYKFVIAAFLSSSKRGVKVLVRIPIVSSVEGFKMLFYGLACKMQWIRGFDPSSQNPILPNYLTYDYDALWREDAVEWTGMGYKEDEFKISELETNFEVQDVTEEDKQEIYKQISNILSTITDQGHYTLRSASLLIGGFCPLYLSFEEAQEFMFNEIENHHYLSSKPNVYKKTAIDMIQRGSMAPLLLNRHKNEKV